MNNLKEIDTLESTTKEQVLILDILKIIWLSEEGLKKDILYESELKDKWFCFESFRTLLEDHFDYSPQILDLFSNRDTFSIHKCLTIIKEHFMSTDFQDWKTNTLVDKIIKK